MDFNRIPLLTNMGFLVVLLAGLAFSGICFGLGYFVAWLFD